MEGQLQSRIESLIAKHQAVRVLTEAMSQRVELDVYPVFEQALSQTAQALGAPSGCLHLADTDGGLLHLVQSHNMTPVHLRAWQRLEVEGDAPPSLAHKAGQVMTCGPGDLAGGWSVSAPVMGFDTPLGVMTMTWPGGDPVPDDPDRDQFMLMVGHLTGLAVEHSGLVSSLVDSLDELRALKQKEEKRSAELEVLNEQLKQANLSLAELSTIDGLTGLYNRRHIEERLTEEIARARRLKHPVTLFIADLDYFKRINDELGHQAGDEALILFAKWLKESIRTTDMVGRYGGEEFLVVLVDCTEDTGLQVAEKIRRCTQEKSQVAPFAAKGGFTVSMGGAELLPGMNAHELVAKADKALYRAKDAGRNRVELAGWGVKGKA